MDSKPVHFRNKQPHCTAFPASGPLADLVRDLVGKCLSVDSEPEAPEKFAVVVDCLRGVRALRLAREAHPGRPLVAVVARPDATEVFGALTEGVDGVICLTDPAFAWRDCVNVVLGGGRWFGGPAVDVSLEDKNTRYQMSRGEQQSGDLTMRTRRFISDRVPEKFAG